MKITNKRGLPTQRRQGTAALQSATACRSQTALNGRQLASWQCLGHGHTTVELLWQRYCRQHGSTASRRRQRSRERDEPMHRGKCVTAQIMRVGQQRNSGKTYACNVDAPPRLRDAPTHSERARPALGSAHETRTAPTHLKKNRPTPCQASIEAHSCEESTCKTLQSHKI